MSDLDDYLNDLEQVSYDTSDLLREMNEDYSDCIDDLVDELDRLEDAFESRNEQDYVIGIGELARHYRRDYSDIDDAREVERNIDIFFKRNELDAPFSEIGLPRQSVEDNEYEPTGFREKLGAILWGDT